MKIAFLSNADIAIEGMQRAMLPHRLILCRTRASLLEQIADCDVLIVQNKGFPYHVVDAEVLSSSRQLKLIQHYGVSFDGTDADSARKKGVRIATTSNANSQSVAELAVHLMLCLAKKSNPSRLAVAAGRPANFLCAELSGKTLCLVGFGRIGKIIARISSGFSMRVIAVKRTRATPEAGESGADAYYTIAELHSALALADYVVLAVPLTGETLDLMDERAFAVMKAGAGLINISRGPNVRRAALEQALAEGRLSGYAADVYWTEPVDPGDPLLRNERVVITPHIGAESAEAIERIGIAVRQNIDCLIGGQPLTNEVVV